MSLALITAGDPGGIGYEILLKALPVLEQKYSLKEFPILCHVKTLETYNQILNLNFPLSKLELVSVGDSRFTVEIGQDSPKNGEIAIACIDKAIELIKKNQSSQLITAPISKKAIILAGRKKFQGHTDYLADAFKIKDYTMMLGNRSFAVALVTIHKPLKRVPGLITQRLIHSSAKNLFDYMKKRGDEKEKIWITGLNPHAGEKGEMGKEEKKTIIPAIEALKAMGIPAEGPFPADALFKKAFTREAKYFLAMYHDQGLIPVKMLGENHTVNITLGLPFFRISVEHGTAFDIAGKNKASSESFLECFKYCLL